MAGDIIASLDLGTTKTAVLIGENTTDGIKILGTGLSPSDGLRRGVVVNMDRATLSIRRALEEAEQTAGVKVDEVVVGFSGEHIESVNSRGAVAVSSGEDHGVTRKDIARAYDAATALRIPIDREVIHVLAQDFIVDDQRRIPDPHGMLGVRLEVLVHIVTGAITSIQNVRKCIRQAGLHVRELVLDSIAASHAVLSRDEKEMGVVLLDLGGGTTDIALFRDGSIRYSSIIPAGGFNLTNDIAIGLRTPHDEAERIKRHFASAVYVRPEQDNTIELPGLGGHASRQITREELTFVVGPRVKELLNLARKEVRESGFEHLVGTGIVITGGGALMPGIARLAEQIFGMSAKVGAPEEVPNLSEDGNAPLYATGVGLLHYAVDNMSGKEWLNGSEGGWLGRMKSRIVAML